MSKQKKSPSRHTEQYYVYALMDPRKPGPYIYKLGNRRNATFPFMPFYIGKGHDKRSSEHLKEALNARHPSHKINIIRDIWRDRNDVVIKHTNKLLDELSAFTLEAELIKAIGRRNVKTGPLSNKTPGGVGSFEDSVEALSTRVIAIKKWWANLVGEDRIAYQELQCYSQTYRWANMSKSKRELIRQKIIETKRNTDHSKKLLIQAHHISGAKKWYASLTDEQRAEMKRKQDLAKRSYVIQTCPHCNTQGKGGNMKRYHFDNCKHV